MTTHAKPDPLPLELLNAVNLALSELLGCLAPQPRMQQLSRALRRAAGRRGAADVSVFCRRIVERAVDADDLEELAAALLPGETYFFRDQPSMDALRQLLPRLIEDRRSRRSLSIWSAACSTGEEPLTLAMLLHSSLAELAGWNIRILATDLRARALEGARRGLYREWSFRGCPDSIKARYFTQQSCGGWQIAPELLAQVAYRQFNLVREPFPPPGQPAGGFDLILCRNMLIYLDPEKIPPLLNHLLGCLGEGGRLLVAAVETPAVNQEGYASERLGETLFFLKQKSSDLPRGLEAVRPGNGHHDPARPPAAPEPVSRRPRNEPEARPERARKEVAEIRADPVLNMSAQRYQTQAALDLEQGNFAAARDGLRRALYLDRHNAMAYILQGHLRLAQGEPARARRSYQTALKLLEQLAPDHELDHKRHLTAAELTGMLHDTLTGLKS